MKLILFITLLLAITSFVAADKEDDEAGVLTLTDANFDDKIVIHKYLLVEFYAPWCGHCKKLTPEWRKASAALKDENITLAKIDCTIEKESGTKYDIKGFPTLKFFDGGAVEDFTGGRTAEEIILWSTKRIGEGTKLLKTQQEYQQFRSENKVCVVYYSAKETDMESWFQLATSYQQVNFAHVTDESLFAKEDEGKVYLYKKFDELFNVFPGSVTEYTELTKFINKNIVGTVMEFDNLAVQAVFHQRTPTAFFLDNDPVNNMEIYKQFIDIAAEFKGELAFTVSNPNDGHGQWSQLLPYLRIKESDLPMIVIVHAQKTKTVQKQIEGEINNASIKKLITDFLSESEESAETPKSGHSDL